MPMNWGGTNTNFIHVTIVTNSGWAKNVKDGKGLWNCSGDYIFKSIKKKKSVA